MAKVMLHPAFHGFSGRIGNLVFYTNLGCHCVRRYVIPQNPRTDMQQYNRTLFADAVTQWQNLPPYKRIQWNNRAKALGKHGYNLFMSSRLRRESTDTADLIYNNSVSVPSMQILSHSVSLFMQLNSRQTSAEILLSGRNSSHDSQIHNRDYRT